MTESAAVFFFPFQDRQDAKAEGKKKKHGLSRSLALQLGEIAQVSNTRRVSRVICGGHQG